jgi:hypothetical protein
VKNGTRHSLARIPLRWMIRECFTTHTGIIFDAHMLRNEVGLDIESIYRAPEPLPPPDGPLPPPQSHGWKFEGEATEELHDALSRIYDPLQEHAYWRAIEEVPCKFSPAHPHQPR